MLMLYWSDDTYRVYFWLVHIHICANPTLDYPGYQAQSSQVWISEARLLHKLAFACLDSFNVSSDLNNHALTLSK